VYNIISIAFVAVYIMLLAGIMIKIWYHCRFKCEMHGMPL